MRTNSILLDVQESMQAAEEAGGPEGKEYIQLMLAIEEHARDRRVNYQRLLKEKMLRAVLADLLSAKRRLYEYDKIASSQAARLDPGLTVARLQDVLVYGNVVNSLQDVIVWVEGAIADETSEEG